MTVFYCYDAYCGWCFGFSKVMTRFYNAYKARFFFEVLSGGMIPAEGAKPVKAMAGYIADAYPRVEALSGVKFGPDYLWHINNPDDSDWFPESLTPATALCIFKEYRPELQVPVAADLQNALFAEGRDLSDPEAYRHLLPEYGIPEAAFFEKLKDPVYEEKARYEFALCRQLQVTGFPKVFLQVNETKCYLVAEGFTAFEVLVTRTAQIMKEIGG